MPHLADVSERPTPFLRGGGGICSWDIIYERRINKWKKNRTKISARYFVFLLTVRPQLPLYMLARPVSSSYWCFTLQPCELVVFLQDSMTSGFLDKRCILPGYPGSRESTVQVTALQTLQHGSVPGSLHICHLRGILKCLHQTGAPSAPFVQSNWHCLHLSFSDCALPPFQGFLNFTHCLWGNAGVVGRAGNVHGEGPFPPLLDTAAVSDLSRCDHVLMAEKAPARKGKVKKPAYLGRTGYCVLKTCFPLVVCLKNVFADNLRELALQRHSPRVWNLKYLRGQAGSLGGRLRSNWVECSCFHKNVAVALFCGVGQT